MKRFRIACVALGMLFVLMLMTQCGRQKESVVAPKIAALVGTWRLVEPDSTYNVTLEFAYDTRNPPQDITPFNASGKSSVNAYTVRLFATLDGLLSADDLVNTDIAGDPKAMRFEQSYFGNLKAVARYEITSTTRLRLYHGGEQPHVLVYEKVK